jgi:hypothetical protein
MATLSIMHLALAGRASRPRANHASFPESHVPSRSVTQPERFG